MRYKYIILVLILIIGKTTAVTSHANSVMTHGKVGFYEVPSTVPFPPSDQEYPETVQMMNTSNQVLPRTGEDSSSIAFIGVFIVALSTLLFSQRNTKST
ncbi:LPXTG cell wall anchor domain-containing protein [Lactococcus garvieae]|uniref:LPXTG cell wall anchor domain-containing protein n=1 Tax=Lactococcus garvieae TaxID=1363 RepID=UPI00385483F4